MLVEVERLEDSNLSYANCVIVERFKQSIFKESCIRKSAETYMIILNTYTNK